MVFMSVFGAQVAKADISEPVIVCSIRPLCLLLDEIKPDHLHSSTLLSASDDPHHFSLSYSQIKLLSKAQLTLWLGPDFEHFLKKALVKYPSLALLNTPSKADSSLSHKFHAHDSEGYSDPHIWLSPEHLKRMATEIARHLVALYPESRAVIDAKHDRLVSRLSRQSEAIAKQLMPYQQSGFIVNHNALEYFNDSFGLKQLAAVSIKPGQRLSLKHLAQLKREAKAAHCLFSEVGDQSAASIAEALSLEVIEVDIMGFNQSSSSIIHLLSDIANAYERCFDEVEADVLKGMS